MKRSVKINTILNFIKTLTGMIFPLITFPYISRVLKPEKVGVLNFGNSFVSYFSLIASLGIGTYAVRECSKVKEDRNQLEKVSSQIYSINICTAVFSYLLLFGVLFFFDELDSYVRIIIIQSASIALTVIGADWLNIAMEDFYYITVRAIVFNTLSIILMFAFVKKQDDYLLYALISTVSSSGAYLVNCFYRRRFCRLRFTFHMHLREHLKPVLLLFVMLVAQSIFSNSDIIMLGIIRSDYEVGIYSTAVKMYNIVINVMTSVLWVMLPRLSNYYVQNNYESINDLLRKNLELMFSLIMPIICGVSIMGGEILRLVAGDEYVEAWPYLVILMVAALFSLIGGGFIGNMIMIPTNREKYYIIACVLAAVVNIVLNFILLPFIGALGASLTTLFAHVILLIKIIPHIAAEIHIRDKNRIFRGPIIGCAGIAAWCLLVRMTVNHNALALLAAVSGSVVLYGMVLHKEKYELFESFLDILRTRLIRMKGRERK